MAMAKKRELSANRHHLARRYRRNAKALLQACERLHQMCVDETHLTNSVAFACRGAETRLTASDDRASAPRGKATR
ncbi:MAG TPA: hypothetical protein VE029_10880 [Rhizobacter sp.]|nr:hypothetical protein [Rhizobacter sp.]